MNWLEYAKGNGLNIISAILILLVGLLVASLVKRWLAKKIRLKSKNPTVKLFLLNAVYILVIIVVLISMLSRLGVPTASMITVLGAGSLAIALSLKESLSHVASGLILISLKPFRIGDTVEINGVLGVVEEINLLTVSIKTFNSDHVVIPNAKVFSEEICTKGHHGNRRIDLTIGISYDADIKQAKALIQSLVDHNKLVLKKPASSVVVKELGDSAVLLAVRPWVKKNDYTAVLFDLTENIKLTFDEHGIEIPFPQITAHIAKERSA